MNMLFVLENYIPHIGGVEVVFKNLSEGLAKIGHDVSVVTHRLKGTKRFEVINGVNVYRVDCFHSRYWFTFLAVPKVFSLAKKADVIHTTTFNGAPPAWLVSKILGKKCVITVHEVWVNKWDKLTEMKGANAMAHNFLEKMIYTLRFDKYVCVSESTRKQLIEAGVNAFKSRVVYNGVDYGFWKPSRYDGQAVREKLGIEEGFVYLFYGRAGVSKGLKYLLMAVPLISKGIPNSKLLAIVSKDPAYRKQYIEMMRMIKRLGIKNNVIVHEPVGYKELPNYVRAADCVVVPSLSEGFGFTAAESCAMGKTVVASNTTSLPEVVSGRYVLVKPRSVSGIAKGVEMAFNGNVMKSRLKKFGLEENIQGYLDVYKEMAGK